MQTNISQSGASALVRCLRIFFVTYGVPKEISTDGGPEFMADTSKQFLRKWGVNHRISSAYFPRSNGRAEVAVKATKRLLRANIGPGGSLNNDRFLQAILQHRNTPDPICQVSPAEILFGRSLRDKLSFTNNLLKFSNPKYRRKWREAWARKERAIRLRYDRSAARLNFDSRSLPPLQIGDRCLIQNQHGRYPKKWERSGVVVQILPFNQYKLRVDGSQHITRRNRKFVRRLKTTSTAIQRAPLNEWESHITPTSDSNPITGLGHESHATDGNVDQRSPTTSLPPRIPRMLKCLDPFNKPGTREDTSVPTTRLRPR